MTNDFVLNFQLCFEYTYKAKEILLRMVYSTEKKMDGHIQIDNDREQFRVTIRQQITHSRGNPNKPHRFH